MSRKSKSNEEVLREAAGGEEGITVAVPGEYGGDSLNDLSRQTVVKKERQVESKSQRFKRLANKRVPRALKALQHVENLGNRSHYQLTEQQADRIIEVLGVACQRVFARLKGSEADIAGFSL